MQSLHGYYFDDLVVGMEAIFSKTITEADIVNYAGTSGDFNPVHVNEEFARATRFHARIAHGLLIAGMISAVLGTRLPGPGAIYVDQQIRFHAPVYIGDTVTACVRVLDKQAERRRVRMHTECRVRERIVLDGEATLLVDARSDEPAMLQPAAQ